MNVLKISQAVCTGCGCCKNVCKQNAIRLVDNKEGFIVPNVDSSRCIDCSLCYNSCPAINYKSQNFDKPRLYSARADDEIRAKSSSGGMFHMLAFEILSNGGYVCGASFDSSQHLKHIIVSSVEELSPLYGSKYLQSDTGLIYSEIEKLLKGEKTVLFTALPCQVAGLYSFLNHRYDRLFTVDLVCHGVPSQKLFNRYLKELSLNNPIKEIKFRDKKYGWTSYNISISLENGELYEGDINTDPYEKAFHNNLMLRSCCESCKFCEFPRCGDISIGDFWGVELLDHENRDAKGTSLVLVNNKKGQSLLEKIADSGLPFEEERGQNNGHFSNSSLSASINLKEQTADPRRLKNRLSSVYPAHNSRERFFELLKRHSFKESVELSLGNSFEIGLVGIYTIGNFGGAMTYYALYKKLTDMGFSVLMIERPKNAKAPPSPLNHIFEKSPYPEYSLAPIYNKKEQMAALNERCATFLTGSDQLFNNYLYNAFGRWITLDWVLDSKKKIAYAASFGHSRFFGTEQTRAAMSYFMQKFDAFSVREKSGVELAKKEFLIDANPVLDPVFLCDKRHYIELSKNSKPPELGDYIGCYILDPNHDKQEIIKLASTHFKFETEIFTELGYTQKHIDLLWDLPVVKGKLERRLSSIINCKLFITDSFHGICFAIIFKKPFFAILNKKRGEDRMTSLLSLLGLSDRLVEGFADFKSIIDIPPIDYDGVYSILNSERERCTKWLSEALASDVKKSSSDYDILNEIILSQNEQLNLLKLQNKSLALSVKLLMRNGGIGFCLNSNILEYINELKLKKEELVIFIAVKDTPGHYINAEISSAICSLGLNCDLKGKHWHSYIAIISSSIVYEALEDNLESVFSGDICGLDIQITSKPLKQGNEAKIIINGVDYSQNKRGLNFVIFDRRFGCIVDSVCFDTHSNMLEAYRNPIEGMGDTL